jgi:hypothetical protein
MLYIENSENVFINLSSVYILLRGNTKRGFILIGCYICNIDQTRNGSYQFRSITDIIKSNIECNCKLIMAGSLKDTRKRKYQEEFIKYGFTSVLISGEERPCDML